MGRRGRGGGRQRVQEAAVSSKVDLLTLDPAAPAAFRAPSGTSTGPKNSSAASATTGLQVINLTMSVSGTYFKVEQFLDAVEGLQRSMLVNTFTIAAPGGSSGSAPSNSSSSTGAAGGGSAQPVDPHALTVTITASVFESSGLGPAPSAAASTPSSTSSTAASPSRVAS